MNLTIKKGGWSIKHGVNLHWEDMGVNMVKHVLTSKTRIMGV